MGVTIKVALDLLSY